MSDSRVHVWWILLCCAAALNLLLWFGSARQLLTSAPAGQASSGRHWHLWLSLVYVVVCGFRSVLPRADVERLCLFDTWLSSVALGRTLATVAEMACVLQWALLLREYGQAARIRWVKRASLVSIVLIAFAEVCSWYAVLSTHFLGNVLEESCWALLGLIVAVCLSRLWVSADEGLRRPLAGGILLSLSYFCFMAFVDVPMYLRRMQESVARGHVPLSLHAGWEDALSRRVVSWDWSQWSPEVPWMTLYFTAAVWVMLLLSHAPVWTGRGEEYVRSTSTPERS